VTPRPRRRTDPRRGVPYNPLLDQGYRSIGDVHSTALPDPTNANDAGERSGRWQGKNKTECGLHSNYWDMKKRFEASKAGQGEGVAEQAPAEPNGAA
jgi:phosphoadenosine phosphosulfate reductase